MPLVAPDLDDRRYDDLLGSFGRDLPAAGFALGVDRVHLALAAESEGKG